MKVEWICLSLSHISGYKHGRNADEEDEEEDGKMLVFMLLLDSVEFERKFFTESQVCDDLLFIATTMEFFLS